MAQTKESIPVILQNAIFSLLLFSPKLLLKTPNRMDYYSPLKEAWTKKSRRPNYAFSGILGIKVDASLMIIDRHKNARCIIILQENHGF